jgi:aminoglycoside 6'-N-acetyltransferase I
MRIIDLRPGHERIIHAVAAMLIEAFQDHWPDAWPDLESALQEVRESLSEDRISRVAVDDNGVALGWIGAIRMYNGHVWELHPLAVSPAAQGKGIGRALVQDLEEQIAARGGSTLWLGSDDEDNLTSLGGVDLYPNPLEHLANIKNLRGHPFEFYQRLGFIIVGVMPDANGFGKPDIYLAKRITKRQE